LKVKPVLGPEVRWATKVTRVWVVCSEEDQTKSPECQWKAPVRQMKALRRRHLFAGSG